jgi:glycosyltransferase involved in cell wall biosynthesis
MGKSKTIYFTVTNNLSYDQRMQRICGSMAKAGYNVVLVGRKMPGSVALLQQPFSQKRLPAWFQKGKLFYIEYNLRLFFYLLFKKMDAVCAIDLDTIIPCYFVSKIKGIKRVYDAHELFTELKEVMSRPRIHKFWMWVERTYVPKFKHGYTVNQFIVEELQRRYGVQYNVVRNLPVTQNDKSTSNTPLGIIAKYGLPKSPFFLYQGAVNEGRSFETLIPAMVGVNATLVIAGNGNFMPQVKKLINQYKVESKVICLGAVLPEDLRQITPLAYYGLTLFESKGLNQYYSLANRFFDYIQGGIPQVCVGYPEYEAINNQYQIAYLIHNLSPESLSATLNNLLEDDVLYKSLKHNCSIAAKQLCWQNEQEKLVVFYNNNIFNS